jgi:hypothetical protein
MQTELALPTVKNTVPRSKAVLEVVLAFEDFLIGMQAKRLREKLVRECGEFFRFICHLWKFELLQHPNLRAQAADEARKAHIIMIAAHEGAELPREIVRWMELCLRGKGRIRALVALLNINDPRTEGCRIVRCCLRRIAERAEVRFTCLDIDWQQEDLCVPVKLTQPHPEPSWLQLCGQLGLLQSQPLSPASLSENARYSEPSQTATAIRGYFK